MRDPAGSGGTSPCPWCDSASGHGLPEAASRSVRFGERVRSRGRDPATPHRARVDSLRLLRVKGLGDATVWLAERGPRCSAGVREAEEADLAGGGAQGAEQHER